MTTLSIAVVGPGAIGGTIAGVLAGQPTVGFLAGLGVGAAVALGIWLKGR